jgi:hypothetical protein
MSQILSIPLSLSVVVSAATGATVEVEETVCTSGNPNNGAGALWCYGAPLIARIGERVFVSAMEVGEGMPPLCNTRPRIFMRDENEWHVVWRPDDFLEREPCPIVCFQNDVMLSVNPLINITESRRGVCNPHLLKFSVSNLKRPPKTTPLPPFLRGNTIQPKWVDKTTFTEHSYRGIAADSVRGEILLLNIDAKTGEQCWSFYDANGDWVKYGRIRFPIRSCYPQVELRNRAAHVLAIGDIVEPKEEWRHYKHEKTKRDWDYVFRRLFYTWTPDAEKADFASPIEVEDVDATGGHISNLDLWVDANGDAHLLYIKQPVAPILRDRYFPNLRITRSLEYCIISNGKVVKQDTLLISGEDITGDMATYARFHATPDGKLFAVYACSPSGMKIMQISPQCAKPINLELQEPFHTFFTASERSGSKRSDIIDIFGIASEPGKLRYARIRLSS